MGKKRMAVPRFPTAALILAAVAATAGCGGNNSVFAPTSAAEATTTITADTTTTVTPPTEAPTTTAAAPATTAEPTPEPTLGPPPLSLMFWPDGLAITMFGDDPGTAIAAAQAYLGFPPTFDSGWVGPLEYGVCPGTEYRRVVFDGLTLQFTDAGYFAPDGARQFFGYMYSGSPSGLTVGLDVGNTLADLLAAYPAASVFTGDPYFGTTFRVDYPGTHEQLWGVLTGDTMGDTIVQIHGGWGCGE